MDEIRISFAGAGRVAGALCRKMFQAGFKIDLIVSESEFSSRRLADFCEASWSTDLTFPDSSSVLIVAVPDKSLKSVLDNIICNPGTLVVHTAGSIGIDVFPEKFKFKGVFYPLQTFSYERQPDFKELPFFLEASDIRSYAILEDITESIGGNANFADAEHRRILHLSAVFACNFTNHMLTIGKEIAIKAGIPFNVLEPIIKETISKAIEIGPEIAQTGPAVRNDQNTIMKHMELLSFSPELQKLYSDMTDSIIKYHKKVSNG
jgi:predicted short-subunit dehydrogenase-like oxidoreductase (DUF2520 family)